MPRIQTATTSRNRITALIFALLISALQLSSPSAFSADAPASGSTAVEPIPDILDLDTALKYAIEHNFSILQARERIREQRGVFLQVRSQALPHLDASGQYTWTDKKLTADSGAGGGLTDLQNWGVSIVASQVLWSGRGIRNAVKAQKMIEEAAALDLQAVINEALLEVRIRFYNVLLAREQIKVQEQNIQLLQEQHTIAKNRFDAGASSSFEVLRAEVAIANAQPGLIRARNGLRTSIDQLRQSLGYLNPRNEDVNKTPEFNGNLDVIRANYDLLTVINAARENRPELQRLATLADAGDALVRSAKSGRLPTISAIGSYTFRKDMFSNPINGVGAELNGWTVGVQGNWAIFDGRATAGRVAAAKSRLAQTHLSSLDATLAIEVEVRSAYSSLQEAAELVDAAQKVVSQAEEALRLADSRYAAGTATQLDVLTSRLSLTESRLNQVTANYSYNVALAALRKATGESDPVYMTAK